jgi:hypothetical protein
MINTATAYSISTTTGPFGSDNSNGGSVSDTHDSQSKLRNILRDQSRREEQQHYYSAPPTYAHSSLKRNSSTTRNLSTRSPSQHSTAMTSSPSSGGYFVGSHNMGTASPSSKRDGTMPHSPSGLDNYMGSSATLTSHLHRERTLRQQGTTDQLGAPSDIALASSNMSRSQSTAGLSNGLDLKVVILGAQGQFNSKILMYNADN